jgi:hypothetical protein
MAKPCFPPNRLYSVQKKEDPSTIKRKSVSIPEHELFKNRIQYYKDQQRQWNFLLLRLQLKSLILVTLMERSGRMYGFTVSSLQKEKNTITSSCPCIKHPILRFSIFFSYFMAYLSVVPRSDSLCIRKKKDSSFSTRSGITKKQIHSHVMNRTQNKDHDDL